MRQADLVGDVDDGLVGVLLEDIDDLSVDLVEHAVSVHCARPGACKALSQSGTVRAQFILLLRRILGEFPRRTPQGRIGRLPYWIKKTTML